MAPFIGKSGNEFRIQIPKCEIPDTFIVLELKLSETEGNADEDYSPDEETIKD